MKDPRKSSSNDSRADFRKSRNKSRAVVAPGVGGVADNTRDTGEHQLPPRTQGRQGKEDGRPKV